MPAAPVVSTVATVGRHCRGSGSPDRRPRWSVLLPRRFSTPAAPVVSTVATVAALVVRGPLSSPRRPPLPRLSSSRRRPSWSLSCFLGCQYRRLNRLYGCLCRSSGPLGRRPWGWIGACHGHGSSRLEGDPAGWFQYLDSRHGHGSGCPEGGQLVGSNTSTVATATAPVVSKAASWSALPSRRSSLPWLRSYRRTRHRRSPTHCPGRRKIESGLGSFVKPAVVPTNRPDGAHCCSSSVGRADFLAGLVIHGPLPDPTDEKRPRLEELAALGGGLMMRSPLSIPPQLFHP